MNTQNNCFATIRRLGRIVAALAVASGIAAMAPAALAQTTGSLSLSSGTPSNCTSFTGFSWNGGQLSVTCVSATPPPAACDNTVATTSFNIVGSGSSVNTGSTLNIQVARNGGCQGAYTVTFGSAGVADTAGN